MGTFLCVLNVLLHAPALSSDGGGGGQAYDCQNCLILLLGLNFNIILRIQVQLTFSFFVTHTQKVLMCSQIHMSPN